MSRMQQKPPHLRIGQVAEMLGVSPSSLRNWETQGLFSAERTKSRYRLYSHDTVRRLRKITRLRRDNGVNPAGIVQLYRYIGDRSPGQGHVVDPVGPTLKQLREERSLTVPSAAEKCGISNHMLSAIEASETLPSIATLSKLTGAYGRNVEYLFRKSSMKKLIRPQERQVISSRDGIQLELLANRATQLQAHIFRIAARATSGGAYRHDGEELLYMLSGKIELWLDEEERYVLAAGDSLCFESTQAHRWCSVTDEESLVLWINTPQTF